MKRRLRTRVGSRSDSIQPVVTLLILLLVCASLFPPSPAKAANGSFAWARSTGGVGGDAGSDITIDSAGNVYTTGRFEGTVDFNPDPVLSYLLTAEGGPDMFIVKSDRNGGFVWANIISGPEADLNTGITVDQSGNVYTTGIFSFATFFGDIGSAGGFDILVSKLNSSGNFVWARGMGGVNDDYSLSIAVDTSGNVYTTGTFQGTANFDPIAGTSSLASAGGTDIFISKLDSNGNFVWARSMGGPGDDYGLGIAVDAGGNVYTTGSFAGIADFDPGAGTLYNLTSAGGYDIFVSKLNSNGSFVWAKSMGGADYEQSADIALDASGNIYTTGRFPGTADFDPGPGTANLTSAGDDDIFVSRLDSNGSFVWARSMGGVSTEEGGGIALDTAGNVYTTGLFVGTADFDPGAGTYTLTNAGDFDIFISKLDGNGSFVWAKRIGGVDYEESGNIAVDASGGVYTTGRFAGTADFDPGAGTASLTSAGGDDIFLSKLQDTAIFTDVPLGYWALDFIERLYGAGITGGCATSPLRYCPEETVTRAQMAVFLLRGIHTAAYAPPAVGGSTGFGDVSPAYWAADFIKQLAAEGITSGCGGGNYCPEQPVTRAQMAVFLLRSKYGAAYTPPAVGMGTGFGDVPPNYWAAAFIKQLVTEGITAGCGSGNYCPEQPVTRAQMAVFLVRTFSLP